MEMASTDSSYDYRDFQHIWNPAKTDDTPKRTREACIRCRSKRSRCDGEKPCHRCRHVHAECEYSQSKMRVLKESTTIGTCESQDDEEEEMDLLHEVHALEDALDKLSAEAFQLKRRTPANREGSNDYPSPPFSNADEDKYAEDEVHEKKDDSMIALGNTNIYTEKKQWVIAMTKKGIRLETTDTRQLYELLVHIVNSAAVHRGPPIVSRPIGTQAMTSLATAQWPRWRRIQKFNTKKRIPIFPPDPLFDVSTLVITSEMEEVLLNLILLQSAECSVALPRKVFIERLFSYNWTQRLSSPHDMALCFALCAMNAQHFLVHHIDTTTLNLSPGFNRSEFGRKLAARYFSKARDLLMDQVFDYESNYLCAEIVDALHAMFHYVVTEGNLDLASVYLNMAIQVATQLDYHKALRDSNDTVVNVAELEKALTWNLLACEDQAIAAVLGNQSHTTADDTHLNLLDITVRVPADMSQDRLQRLNEFFYMARSSAISRDYLNAWWGDGSTDPTKDQLDQFVAAFARWEEELPFDLRILPSSGTVFRSRISFFLAVNVQLHHQISLINLYYPFTRAVHPNLSSLPPELPEEAERVCSQAAVMATRLLVTYVREGGCMFSINVYPIASNAHMRLAMSKDEKIAKTNRAYVARVLRTVKWTKEYQLRQHDFWNLAMLLEEFMLSEGIDVDADAKLGPEDDYFTVIRAPGVGW